MQTKQASSKQCRHLLLHKSHRFGLFSLPLRFYLFNVSATTTTTTTNANAIFTFIHPIFQSATVRLAILLRFFSFCVFGILILLQIKYRTTNMRSVHKRQLFVAFEWVKLNVPRTHETICDISFALKHTAHIVKCVA